MKKLRWLVLLLGLTLGLWVSLVTVHAENGSDNNLVSQTQLNQEIQKSQDSDDDQKTAPKTVKQGGVTLEGQRFALEKYRGYAKTNTLDFVGKSLVAAGNGMFGISKLMYQGFDTMVDKLATAEFLNQEIDELDSANQKIWDYLTENFLGVILLIVGIMAVYLLVLKADLVGAMQIIGRTVFVFIAGMVFIASAPWLMKSVNNLSSQFAGQVMKIGTTFDGQGTQISSKNPEAGSAAIMRNYLFDNTVKRPYLLMNYGTTNEDKINQKSKIGGVDALLEASEPQQKVRDKESTAFKSYMDATGDNDNAVTVKMAVGFMSLITTIGYGLPLVIIALMNLLIQIGIMVMMVLVPLAFFVSMFPQVGFSGYRALAQMLGLFFYRAVMAMLVMFAMLASSIMDDLIKPNSVGGYLANVIMMAVIFWMLLLNQDRIVTTITGGTVQFGSGNQIRQGGQQIAARVRNIENPIPKVAQSINRHRRNKYDKESMQQPELLEKRPEVKGTGVRRPGRNNDQTNEPTPNNHNQQYHRMGVKRPDRNQGGSAQYQADRNVRKNTEQAPKNTDQIKPDREIHGVRRPHRETNQASFPSGNQLSQPESRSTDSIRGVDRSKKTRSGDSETTSEN